MRLLLSVGLLLAVAGGGRGAAAQTGQPVEARIARIEQGLAPRVRVEGRDYPAQRITDLMRDKGVPAVSIAVINNGQVEWARAYGQADPATGRAATPETLFQAASISKAIAAMGALDLVEDGRLALDEPVNAKLKDWRVPDNALTRERPVTLRHLLTHSGGLTVHGFPGYAVGESVPSVRQILDGAPPANTAAVIVDQKPGAAFRYSGGGITIAQQLMTDVTGQPFPALMQARVLRPLGMGSSTYDQPLPAALSARAAVAHRADGKAVPGGHHLYPEMAAAGLWTTPTDLARWVIALQDTHAGRSGSVLTQATARAMLTPGLGDWGLGLAVSGQGDALRFSHGGSNEGYRAQMIGFLQGGRGVVVMTNSDLGNGVIGPLLTAVAKEYGWPGYDPRIIKVAAVSADALRAASGVYELEGFVLTVAPAAGDRALQLTMPSGEKLELIPQGDDLYLDTRGAAPIRFLRNASGAVTGVDLAGTKLTRRP